MNRMIYDLQINKLNYQLLDKTAASEARDADFLTERLGTPV